MLNHRPPPTQRRPPLLSNGSCNEEIDAESYQVENLKSRLSYQALQ